MRKKGGYSFVTHYSSSGGFVKRGGGVERGAVERAAFVTMLKLHT